MTDLELEKIIEDAATRGARKVLHDLGLSDDDAIHDVRDLREALRMWKDVRSSAVKVAVRICVTGLFAMLSLGIWNYVGKQ